MTRKTKNIAHAIRQKLARDPDLAAAVEAEKFNINVSGEVYRARIQAGLTQQELADRIGTHQSVVARLESADYDGHSLKMLNRIAEALNKTVRVAFVDQAAVAAIDASQITGLDALNWDDQREWTAEFTTALSIQRM
jgi:transcriptional regulator with XRE-family HTH domain